MGFFDLFGLRGPTAWREIRVDELEAERKTARLIDVREPDEYAAAHIEGAELVPLSTVTAKAADWDREKPLLVICRSGVRSSTACRMLHQLGFTQLVNVSGGMNAWQSAGYPIGRGGRR